MVAAPLSYVSLLKHKWAWLKAFGFVGHSSFATVLLSDLGYGRGTIKVCRRSVTGGEVEDVPGHCRRVGYELSPMLTHELRAVPA